MGSNDPKVRAASADDINYLRERARRRELILAGDVLPTREDRECGLPPLSDSPHADMRRLAMTAIDRGRHDVSTRRLLRRVVDAPSIASARAAADAVDDRSLAYCFDWNAALLGAPDAARRVLDRALVVDQQKPVQSALAAAFALSLVYHTPSESKGREYEAGWIDRLLGSGLERLRRLGRSAATHDDAVEQLERQSAEADVTQLLEAVVEDRAEVAVADDDGAGGDLLGYVRHRQPDTLVVVPAFEIEKKSTDRQKVRNEFAKLAGVPLPLVERGDIAGVRTRLVDRWPHLVNEIDTILRDLAVSETVRFRPTILVGSPGAGKTALARALAEALELPATVYGAGGFADGTFAGIAAVWSSSGPCTPLLAVRDGEVANPLVIVDEIDKAARSIHNGSLQDALLQFLEPINSGAYRDPSLELVVDLSRVNYILTANELEPISRPLRDRCRVIKVPDPGPEHVEQIARHVVGDIAADRGIDPRWYAPLAGDEIEVLLATWRSGSIRKLRRCIELMLDGRDQLIGRA